MFRADFFLAFSEKGQKRFEATRNRSAFKIVDFKKKRSIFHFLRKNTQNRKKYKNEHGSRGKGNPGTRSM